MIPLAGWKEFNVNDKVRIKLLPRGVEMFDQYHRGLGLDPAPYWKMHPPDADGWREFQAWEMMHLFGGAMMMGPPPPFETTILFEVKA